MSERVAYRVPVSAPVDISVGPSTYKGFLRNISSTGVYLHTMEELTPGSTTRLKFTLPGQKKVFDSKGVVKWSTKPGGGKAYFGGSGIMFTSVSPEDEKVIKKFITSEAKRLCLDG